MAVFFLTNAVETMIFESIKGRYEKVFFLAFKTNFLKEKKMSEIKLFR